VKNNPENGCLPFSGFTHRKWYCMLKFQTTDYWLDDPDLKFFFNGAKQKDLCHLATYIWAGNQLPAGKIADIGSESGFGMHVLYREDRSVHGVDIDHGALIFSNTKINHKDKYHHIMADGHKLPFADDSYDGICLINTLHLSSEPIALLEECRRVLRKMHYLIVSIPSNFNLPDDWRTPGEMEFLTSLLSDLFIQVEVYKDVCKKIMQENVDVSSESTLITAKCVKK